MQPSKQPILPQIIDTYFLDRFSYFSCQKYPQELQLLHLKPIYHLNRVFARNLQEMSKMVLNVCSLSEVEFLQFCSTQPLWFYQGLEAGSSYPLYPT